MSHNLRAMLLMGELVEFDRMRYVVKGAGSSERENLDGFIADGAACYQSLLAVLHGEERVDFSLGASTPTARRPRGPTASQA